MSRFRPAPGPDTGSADDRADQRTSPAADGHGGGLVLAPMPGLPTRWDALDQGDTSRPAAPGNGLALRNHSMDDPAFAPLAVLPGEYPAPLPVVAPLPATAALPASLYDDVYKVCFRLTGVAAIAHDLARQAVRSSATATAPGGDPLTAMTTAVNLSIACELPDETRIPYYQHRARLRRDLARRSDRDRAILAVRHLVVVPPSGVAARLGVAESQVRETGSEWCPDDSRVDSLALLRGIDSWISSDLGSSKGGFTGAELDHLDEPAH